LLLASNNVQPLTPRQLSTLFIVVVLLVRLAIHLGTIAHRDNKHWLQNRNTKIEPMEVQQEQAVGNPDMAVRKLDKDSMHNMDKPSHRLEHRL
jgi:hypothetical protein